MPVNHVDLLARNFWPCTCCVAVLCRLVFTHILVGVDENHVVKREKLSGADVAAQLRLIRSSPHASCCRLPRNHKV